MLGRFSLRKRKRHLKACGNLEFSLPECRCRHHVTHTNVDTLIVPLISRNVLSAPQGCWKIFTERDGLDLCRYQATRVLKYLFICGLGITKKKTFDEHFSRCRFKLRTMNTGTLCCVLEQDTSLPQCLSPPRCINGYRRT